ncbi:hypothetical protein [Duganella sp. HH101]|uniref:hypothetical protein n=1 Tax=Duganella sp. HH101 TaxID=1781066 RepID=UPI0008941A6F|nr:hypothetical protein [Duganella sp. HH101]OFA05871.1 hypothetical protein DUGA2_14510 [Duganella sp. HH101]
MKSSLLVLLLAGPAVAQSVTATLSATDSASLELRYDIPATCDALNFSNPGIAPPAASDIRRDWTALDDCAEVDSRQVRRKAASCTSLRFRVPAATRNLDRVYPWAYPIGQGFYAHTSAYAVSPASCGAVDWKFSAPGGAVVVDGVPSDGEAALPSTAPQAHYTPVALLLEPLPQGRAAKIHVDPSLPAADVRFLEGTIVDATAYLSKALPDIDFPVPYIIAVKSPDANGWRGDVANRNTMRLTISAATPARTQPALRSYLAHEVSHLLQPSGWKDAWKDDQPMISEGGADFLSWRTSAALGWQDREALKDELEKAVNGCLAAVGGANWRQTANRQQWPTPYVCGLTFHVIGLASRANDRPAMLMLRDYYGAAQRTGKTDFAQALECGAAAGCQPRWLSRVAGKEPLAEVVAAYARTPGALFKPAEKWSAATTAVVAHKLVEQLMRADCGGAVSIYNEPTAARIAAGPACKALRPGMGVVGAEGRPLFSDQTAARAVIEACSAKRQARLGLEDGGSVDIACDAATVSLPAEQYSVDIDAALKRL